MVEDPDPPPAPDTEPRSCRAGLCAFRATSPYGQLAVWISQPAWLHPTGVVRRGRRARRPEPAPGSDPVRAHSRPPASHEDVSALQLLGLAHARCPSENENQEDVEQDEEGRPGQDVIGPVHPDHATRLAGRHRTKSRSRRARTEREPRRAAQGRGSWEEDVLERRRFPLRRWQLYDARGVDA